MSSRTPMNEVLPEAQELLTLQQVATVLGFRSRGTIWKQYVEGRLPLKIYKRSGGDMAVKRSELDEYIAGLEIIPPVVKSKTNPFKNHATA